MKKKKKSLVLIGLLMAVGLTSGYVASTYAKYVKTLDNATGQAQVAKWDFKKGADADYGKFVISLPENVNTTTLAGERIAPGTSGTFTIALDNSDSEVGVEYEITFDDAENVPSNLILKKDSTTLNVSNAKIVGTIPAGQSDSVAIAWEWPYETTDGDDADRADGEAAKTMSLTASITGHQVQPSATGIEKTYTLQSAS